MRVFSIIEREINNFLDGGVFIVDGYYFSQQKLIKRILIYANGIYPDGKLDSQGNYKYWFDICQSRIDGEVKNIDFDTKHISLYVDPPNERFDTPLLIANSALKEWLRETGQSEEINNAIEEGSGWGNVVWKKTKDSYEMVDIKNFYVINQIARTLEETPVIERHEMTQSQLRAKAGIWNNIDEVIEEFGNKKFSGMQDETHTNPQKTETPYYEIFERNGEISVAALKEAKGEKPAEKDENKYVLAKIVLAGLQKGDKKDKAKVLFADEISKMPYKEYHRGRYNGRWMRLGIYEILFDIQTRANEIGNQIARGLEWASKIPFKSLQTTGNLIVENILTDINSGDIIKGDISQIEVRMQGFDQLVADWNRLMELANRLTNSYEVIQGESLPSGTPFRLGALLNQNANKLFDFIREKLGIVFEDILEEWILPDLFKNLKTKDVIEITGDTDFMNRYYEAVANGWYLKNLIAIGPHTLEAKDMLIQKKIEELKQRPQSLVKYEKDLFTGLKAKAQVIITGENVSMLEDLETFSTFASIEQDPVRRTALIERAMRIKGVDVSGLPKSPPAPPPAPAGAPTGTLPTSRELMPSMAGETI